jgi:glycosyltransferase involved in cell wall biosynthesis
MPRVTVLLPVFNGARYLKGALGSVIAQSYKDFELLVIDDGSTDQTPAIVTSFHDMRIKYLRHNKNEGLIASLNEGIALSEGEYIARMDADDICDPRRLSLQTEFLDHNPDVGVVGTAVRLMDDNGRPGLAYVFPEEHEAILWAMAFLCPIAHPSVMMRRGLVSESGGYSRAVLHAEDYDLWERLSTKTRMANLPLKLLNLRKHEASVTSREAKRHNETARAVSARCMSRRLGYSVSEEVSSCLVYRGHYDDQTVRQSAEVLLDLLGRFEGESEEVRALVRRDAAIRMAMLGLRNARGRRRLALLSSAHSLDCRVWTRLLARVAGRFTRLGRQRLMG